MGTLTDIKLARTVLGRLAPLGEAATGLFLPDIAREIPAARKMVAMTVAKSGDKGLLQKAFNLGAISDSYNLNSVSALQAAEPLLINCPFQSVTVGGIEARYINGKQLLDIKNVSDGQLYYALEGTIIYFKSATSPVAGTLIIIANYIPLTATFEDQFEPLLLSAISSNVTTAQANG